MAVKIERGGWILIFIIGVGLVAYALNRYGIVSIPGLGASSSGSTPAAGVKVDPTQPLPAAAKATNEVRVRVNIWVGCVGGLVANGGLDTQQGSIYADKGLKVTFKIICMKKYIIQAKKKLIKKETTSIMKWQIERYNRYANFKFALPYQFLSFCKLIKLRLNNRDRFFRQRELRHLEA